MTAPTKAAIFNRRRRSYRPMRRVRRMLDISQVVLAERTGLSRVTISRIENNRTRPADDTMSVIASALGVPQSSLSENLPLESPDGGA